MDIQESAYSSQCNNCYSRLHCTYLDDWNPEKKYIHTEFYYLLIYFIIGCFQLAEKRLHMNILLNLSVKPCTLNIRTL